MKKYILGLIPALFCTLCLYGQKPVVNFETYKTWTTVNGGDISPDGKFALYYLNFESTKKRTLHLSLTTGRGIFVKDGLSQVAFTNDSRYLVGILNKDTLMVYSLADRKFRLLPDVNRIQLNNWNGKQRIFVQNKTGLLTIRDFDGKEAFSAGVVSWYLVASNGDRMLLKSNDTDSKHKVVSIVAAANNKVTKVYRGNNPTNFITDHTGTQFAFFDGEGQGATIYYYHSATDRAVRMYSNDTLNVVAGSLWTFSKDGSRIFFSLREQEMPKKNQSPIGLEVWSYEDRYLRTYYEHSVPANREFLCTIDVNGMNVHQLTNGDDNIVDLASLKYAPCDDYCIVEGMSDVFSMQWPDKFGRSYYLCDTRTGRRTLLSKDRNRPLYVWSISPLGKYALYYDPQEKSYISYEISKGISRKITSDINEELIELRRIHYFNAEYFPAVLKSWLPGDSGLLMNGTYDVFNVDPGGIRPTINITGGMGEREKIVFTFAVDNFENLKPCPQKDKILLWVRDQKTMKSGFWTADAKTDKGLQMLSMDNQYLADSYTSLGSGNMKESTSGYLLLAETGSGTPNYYFSKDLKRFLPISHNNPQLAWNWLKAELHTYKDSLGRELKGVLYKPENFDLNKKYPIIFAPYEFKSHWLNQSVRPYLRGAEFTYPLMVSNGYLVFLPDIVTIPKKSGEATVLSLEAAINHVSKFNYVDTLNMGLVGHSFGGFLVNYSVGHCNKFKAALSGAGVSDMISCSMELTYSGEVNREFTKSQCYAMESELWDDPKPYIENSAILSVKNIKTPLLLLHNDGDEAVEYLHSRKLFILMRSLQKPCWWLNYKGQGHHVGDEAQLLDYNQKVLGYFDHFLKGKEKPDWMKEHI